MKRTKTSQNVAFTANKKSKKQLSKFTAEQQAVIDSYRESKKNNKNTDVNLTEKFREQSKGETITLKFVLRDIRAFDRAEKVTLENGKMTFMPIFPSDFELPESFKTMHVEFEEVKVEGAQENEKRMCVVFGIFPNDNSRREYDEEWAVWRVPLKHFELLTKVAKNFFSEEQKKKVDDAFASKQWDAAVAESRKAVADAVLTGTFPEEFKKQYADLRAFLLNPLPEVAPKELTVENGDVTEANGDVAHNGDVVKEEEAPKEEEMAVAKVEEAPKEEEMAVAKVEEAPKEEGAKEDTEELPKTREELMQEIVNEVDDKYGVDKLPKLYEIRMRNGFPTRTKLPKKKCKNVEELLNCCFGDIVVLEGMNLSAYVWQALPKDKQGVRLRDEKTNNLLISTIWPKKASINMFANRARIERSSPTTLKHAFDFLHEAAPSALAHPVITTVWQDVFSAKRSGDLHSVAGTSDEASALNTMASVLRITNVAEEDRLVFQRAGTITQTQEFIEDTEESMLTSSNKSGTRFMALKIIADMKTWWPMDAQTTMFSMESEKCFAYRSTLMLRSYEEHLFKWVPMRNIVAWAKIAPSLLNNFNAYVIFSRDVNSAWNFEPTRDHEHGFRTPFMTNERRLAEVQVMETGWMKRWAIDIEECVRNNGVPVSSAGVKWLFDNYGVEVPRIYSGESINAITTSNMAFSLNEISDSEFNKVVNAPPGTYRFYAISSGWVPTHEYSELFEQLHESGAAVKGENLASSFFRKQNDDDFIAPHPLVVESRLPSIPLGKPTYIFAVDVETHKFESEDAVRGAMCKMLGYDKDDKAVQVGTMCADIAKQAALNDALLLPSLQRIEGIDEGVDDAAWAAVADEAEKKHQETTVVAPPLPPPVDSEDGKADDMQD